MLGTYGAGSIGNRSLTFEQWFGLWLNRERIAYQRAAEVAHGIAVALGAKPDKGFLDALSDADEQAKDAEFQSKVADMESAVMARYGLR